MAMSDRASEDVTVSIGGGIAHRAKQVARARGYDALDGYVEDVLSSAVDAHGTDTDPFVSEDGEVISTKCGRCGGDGVLNGAGEDGDRIRCPECSGDGSVQKPVSELDVYYCPWCDEEQPHADNRCVECGSDD